MTQSEVNAHMAKFKPTRAQERRLAKLTPNPRPQQTDRRTSHKYGAVKTEIDGYKFDSKREGERYRELVLMIAAGEISGLIVHPVWPIRHKDVDICFVILDFSYWDKRANTIVHEDVKGFDTAVSRLKRKLLLAFYGINVRVIK
jgi:hypothetical protein